MENSILNNDTTNWYDGMLDEMLQRCCVLRYSDDDDFKTSPMCDDCYANWKLVLKQSLSDQLLLLRRCQNLETILEYFYLDKNTALEKECIAITKYCAFENDLQPFVFLSERVCKFYSEEKYFFKSIINDDEFATISKYLFVKQHFDIRLELRESIRNLNIDINQLQTRQDIFKYRLKWLIPLLYFQNEKRIYYDYSFQLVENSIKINTDIYIERMNRKLFIMFTNCNLHETFECEEFYKMISLLLLASVSLGNCIFGIVCSNRCAYCISMVDGIGIVKYDLTSLDDFCKFFVTVTQFVDSLCIKKFCEAKRKQLLESSENKENKENKENESKLNIKGIEKQKKSKNKLALEKRRILSDITNLK